MQGYAAAAADDEAPDHKIDLDLSEEDSHEFLSALTGEFSCKAMKLFAEEAHAPSELETRQERDEAGQRKGYRRKHGR
jgi:hypothetical protein